MVGKECNHKVECSIFFNDSATTEIYTLSLHDALPICLMFSPASAPTFRPAPSLPVSVAARTRGSSMTACTLEDPIRSVWKDRKSTRLNSSHANISYAVFCLKKKHSLAFHSALHTSYLP